MGAAVSVQGLGKRYQISHQAALGGRLTESLWGAMRSPLDRARRKPRETTEWFWALRDVSFDIQHGDIVGVIGRNGAGKSTLLKILSRITEPTTGQAEIRGRVGSLLEVGTGFHPELTGRENISLSGAVLGMKRDEINRKFDEIVAFAGVEQFLDTPVKRYSSGMQVRLGFAIAAHLEPEILIIDEVLAVGDSAFQKKCLAKIEDASHEGRTILFVSHSMAAVESLCTSAVLLDHGTTVKLGSAHDVVDYYLMTADEISTHDLASRRDRHGDGRLTFVRIDHSIRTANPAELRLSYVGSAGLRNVSVSVGLSNSKGEGALYLANELTGDQLDNLPERGTFVCRIERAPLLPGRYSVNLYCTVNGVLADWVLNAATISVTEGDFFGTGRLPPPSYGSVTVAQRWSVETTPSRLELSSDR